MRIASFTMVGQFPHGIDLHARNLQWALTPDDHAFIVTLPEYIEEHSLSNGENVTYVPFPHGGEGFVNFWAGFPALLKRLKVDPEWFLFMEEDIWFHRPLGAVPGNPKEIINYLPLQNHYHAVEVGGKLFHPRVWEGANLVSAGIVHRAVERGINFSFAKQFFCERELFWQEKVGGPISLRYFHKKPDTFDEFSLYCAICEGTHAKYEDRAVHLRGPESLHRHRPDLYRSGTTESLVEAQKALNYLCVFAATAPYYIAGNWSESPDVARMMPMYKEQYRKLVPPADWMKNDEGRRLSDIVDKF